MADYETQIVVIAGGPSGLSAAVQAAEDGAEVIVVEKAAAVGGAANMGMGPLGIGTKYQKQNMIDISVEKAFNMFMEYTHYNVDARLVKRYFEQSGETIEWLEDMGVEFEGAFRYFPKSEATWHIVKTDTGIGPVSYTHLDVYKRQWLSEENEKGISGNYGILDQIAALKWVERNIEKFGGDKNNITVFGQSAGSMSTQILISSKLTENIPAKAIMQSGMTCADSLRCV